MHPVSGSKGDRRMRRLAMCCCSPHPPSGGFCGVGCPGSRLHLYFTHTSYYGNKLRRPSQSQRLGESTKVCWQQLQSVGKAFHPPSFSTSTRQHRSLVRLLARSITTMSSIPPVIAWDYQFAPNAQKSRNYLYATGTPFRICEQPFVLPRPILTDLGITYRRVPVLSIGKDVFCDNTSFIDAMQEILEKQGKGLKRGRWDRAFEAWGYRSFWICLPCVPADLITEGLAKDRANLFRMSNGSRTRLRSEC